MRTVEILLSVYGNAVFLGDFLQSLKQQDHQDFRLLYRFDGKADSDAERMLKEFPRSMELPGREHKGVVCSYRTLMNSSSADYLMLADQDDVWHPDKISVSVAALKKLENESGEKVPLLVHADLRVVDHTGRLISPSLWKFQTLYPEKNQLHDLMIQNNVTGCTVILNRALADMTDTFPEAAVCHDWYLAMMAAAFGKIAFLNRPVMDYRQHPGNVFGAVSRCRLITGPWNRRSQLHERIVLTQKQASAFLNQFRTRLAPEQAKLLDVWGNDLQKMRYRKRLFTVLRYQFRKNDWLRTLGMWWAL